MNPGSPLKLASSKIRAGNPGKHKSEKQLKEESEQEIEPEILTEVPKPPGHFNKEAKAEWKYICSVLIERGALASGMLAPIARMCYTNAYVENMEKLQAPPNAALLGQLRLMYESFGLTLRSISQTKSLNAKKKESKLARFQCVK